MSDLPTREEVAEAWAPFHAKYPEYLAESNHDAWLMQDKIVHAYMTGKTMTRVEWEATIDRQSERICIYPHREANELLELAWGLIANAYGGDWSQASEASGWEAAAARWRDRYHGQHDPDPFAIVDAAVGEETP